MPIIINNSAHQIDKLFDGNEYASTFVAKYPIISADSFQAFGKWYWDTQFPRGAGAKFSERVFTYWIYKVVGEMQTKVLETHYQCKLIIPTVIKDIDLYIKTEQSETLIEFKCNIDMIEKDLFKLMHLNEPGKRKCLFIWEKHDSSTNRDGEDSSYMKLLKFFSSEKYGIDYFYFPLSRRTGQQNQLQNQIDTFLKYIKPA